MLEFHNVTRQFGPQRALRGIDWQVAPGEFVALVGPNGAGKTTLLRIAALLTRPSGGTVRIAGEDPARAGTALRQRIGFLSHRTLLYDDLTAEQNLRFYARLYALPEPAPRIAALLERVGLAARRDDPVRTLSRGMQQRLAVARAVLHQPDLLLLDEPFTGLDPLAAQGLSDLLIELGGAGVTIVASLHELERGLALAGRITVLARGRIVYDAPREALDPPGFPALYAQLVTAPERGGR